MDDFLHNLRTGKFRRGSTDRRQHENPQYRGAEKRGGKERRDTLQRRPVPPERTLALAVEIIPTLKDFLETFCQNQKRLAEIDELKIRSEERTAEALGSIAESLRQLAGSGAGACGEERTELESSRAFVAAADRDRVMEVIQALRTEGASYEKIAENLDSQGIPTLSGKGRWHGQTVQKLHKQLEG